MASSSPSFSAPIPLTTACAAVRRGLLCTVAASQAPAPSSSSSSPSTAPPPGSATPDNSDTPMLVIAGVDSGTHVLHEGIVKYLALGAPDVHEPTLQTSVAHLDDTAFLLTRRSLALVNTAVDSDDALHALAKLRGARVSRVSPKEREGDGEVAELFKVLSFVDAISGRCASGGGSSSAPSSPGHPSVAVPLGLAPPATAEEASKRAKEVEFWPLVQAYALQDIGPGGFFTMRHRVSDVGPQLLAGPLSHMDAHAFKRLAWGGCTMLGKQWKAFEGIMGQIRNFSRRGTVLSCEAVAEPLVSYFEFAAVQRSGSGGVGGGGGAAGVAGGMGIPSSPFVGRGARFLVGKYTSTIENGAASVEGETGISLPLAQCGGSLHAIAEADDPSTGLRVCRTIALAAARPSAGTAAAPPAGLATVMSAYASLVRGVRRGIEAAFRTLLPHTAAGMTRALVDAVQSAVARETAGSYPGARIVVDVDTMDASGRSMGKEDAAAGSPSVSSSSPFPPRRLLYVKAALCGLKAQGTGEDLGAVAVGDTIIAFPGAAAFAGVSPLATDGQADCRPALLLLPLGGGTGSAAAQAPRSSTIVRVLTAHIPLSLPWCVTGEEGKAAHALAEAVATAAATAAAVYQGPSREGAAQAAHDAFAVGNYGGGVGSRGRPGGVPAYTRPETGDEAGAAAASSATAAGGAGGGSASPSATASTDDTGFGGLLASLGKLLPAGVFHGVTLLTGGSLSSSLTGSLRVYERGCVLLSPSIGPVVISAPHHVDAGNSTRKGIFVALGSEVLAEQLKLPQRTSDVFKLPQAGWVDAENAPSGAAAAAVGDLARSLVDAAGTFSSASSSQASGSGTSGSASSAAPNTSTSAPSGGAAVDAALANPPDAVIFRLRSPASLPPAYAFAGIPSTLPELADGRWAAIVLPAGSELRSCLLGALDGWRDAAGSSSSSADSSSEGGADGDAELAGNFPASLLPGYVRSCPYAWAWTTAWEDCHALECALHADADVVRRALGGQAAAAAPSPSPSPSAGSATPVYIISSAAGGGATAFARGWAAASVSGARQGGVIVVDCTTEAGGTGTGTAKALNPSAVHAAVSAALAPHAAAPSSSSSSPRPAILLVPPHHADPADVAAAVLRSSGFSVAGCVSVVCPRHAFADERGTQLLPCLAEQLSAGWCQAVVLTGVDEKVSLPSSATALAKKAAVSPLVAAEKEVERLLSSLRQATGGYASHGVHVVKVAGGGAPNWPVTLPLPTAQALLRDLPSFWSSPRAAAQRHLSVPGWEDSDGGILRPSPPAEGVLHVYAPEGAGQAGGATVTDLAHIEGAVRRVLAFLPVAASSTVTLPLPAAMEEAALHATLRKLVALRVDRPAAVCAENAAEEEGDAADEKAGGIGGSATATATTTPKKQPAIDEVLSGLRVGVRTSAGEGEAYVTAWHVRGVVRLMGTDADEEGDGGAAGAASSSAGAPGQPTHLPRLYAVDATPEWVKLVPLADCPQLYPTPSTLAPSLQITGLGLEVGTVSEGLRRAFLSCRPSFPAPAEERSVGSLTPRDLAAIVRAHAADDLPADVTYDGAGGYFDMEGKHLAGHPNAHVFAARHVQAHNAAASVWNRLVAAANAAAGKEAEAVGLQLVGGGQLSTPDSVCVLTWPGEKDATDAGTIYVPPPPRALAAPGAVSFTKNEDGEEEVGEGEGEEDGASPPARVAAGGASNAAKDSSQPPPTEAPRIISLPATTTEPWWRQVKRASAWLRSLPLNVTALRLA